MAHVGDVLYRKKGKSESDSETTNDSEDVWDDKVLINFYDKALKVAQEQVAKRLAMSTNTVPDALENESTDKSPFKIPNGSNAAGSKNRIKKKCKKKRSQSPQNSVQNANTVNAHTWKVGNKCRAIFSENGIAYEATVECILDEENCIVTYAGYENQEVVPLSSLEPSLGKYQRILQTQQANLENGNPDQIDASDNEPENTLENEMNLECRVNYVLPSAASGSEDGPFSPIANNKIPPKPARFFSPEKRGAVPTFQFPPFVPSSNHHSMLPPPPMPFIAHGNNPSPDGDEALSKMLISWYMSGYYTGLYEGQKNTQRQTKKRSRYRM